ncbi:MULTISPECIES: hypothetical protein [unclassified Gordonia (in: high G+C Gram-positive bacteria)]|uniref:hypothetical protein n=1 Tax=unclassified Gordonia (in: high G+C Gram-positive bacteria) TaxID=2657482 RepID=UPI001F0F9ED9|nr:hypothetical protein [Gordonia sp. ABSL49_1]MCH5644068.1 hypothetical protein [Gordonia sp. ABSL49_1]
MFRFGWLVRTALAIAAMATAIGVLGACGTAEESAPDGVALPGDFPKDQVPLLDGTVLSASGTQEQGWTVTIQGPANGGNQLDVAVKKLTDDGYVESSRNSVGGQMVVILSADKDGTKYVVTVGTSPQAAAGASSVIYQVTAA